MPQQQWKSLPRGSKKALEPEIPAIEAVLGSLVDQ